MLDTPRAMGAAAGLHGSPVEEFFDAFDTLPWSPEPAAVAREEEVFAGIDNRNSGSGPALGPLSADVKEPKVSLGGVVGMAGTRV